MGFLKLAVVLTLLSDDDYVTREKTQRYLTNNPNYINPLKVASIISSDPECRFRAYNVWKFHEQNRLELKMIFEPEQFWIEWYERECVTNQCSRERLIKLAIGPHREILQALSIKYQLNIDGYGWARPGLITDNDFVSIQRYIDDYQQKRRIIRAFHLSDPQIWYSFK